MINMLKASDAAECNHNTVYVGFRCKSEAFYTFYGSNIPSSAFSRGSGMKIRRDRSAGRSRSPSSARGVRG